MVRIQYGLPNNAGMVELVDTTDLSPVAFGVRVRVSLPAPFKEIFIRSYGPMEIAFRHPKLFHKYVSGKYTWICGTWLSLRVKSIKG